MFAFSVQITLLGIALLGAPNAEQVLSLLDRDLTSSRQSTPRTPASCPDSLSDLLGVPLDRVESHLGPGDVVDHGPNEHGVDVSVHQYLFADSSTQWLGLAPAAGVGTAVAFPKHPFTVLRLVYDPRGLVKSVSCHVASGA